MSLEQLIQELMEALLNTFGRDDNGCRQYMLVETFPDYLIARGPDGDLYQIPYTVGATDDEITFGEPQEVETAYVPVAEAATFLAAAEGADPNSPVFPVEVMREGIANGSVNYGGKPLRQYFPAEVVAQVAEAVNGARFGRRHPVGNESEANQPELVAGWLDGGRMSADGKSALANVHLLESEKDLQAKLSAARTAGKLDLFGVSVLGYFGFQPRKINGEDVLYATRLGKLARVDLVAEPAAGGRFLNDLRMAASADLRADISRMQREAVKDVQNGRARAAGRQKGEAMKDRILKLLAAMRKHNAATADTLTQEFNGLSDDKHQDFLMKVTEAALTIEPSSATGETAELVKTALAETKKIQSANLVERKLTEAKLPKPAENLVRTHLADRVVTEAEVDAEIKTTRDAFAAYATIGRTTGVAGVLSGMETVDKVQLAMDRLLGVKEAQGSGVASFRGIRDAYVQITGDRDLTFGQGGFHRTTEAIATTDFPNILLNSMTKRLLQDYAAVGTSGLDQIITTANINDYKSQDRVRLGYLGDLPTVAEAGPYTELTKPTDEKVSYTVGKKGGMLTISEETIRNDDLGKIAQFPQRLARAGAHTLKAFITAFLTSNPNYDPDGVAWFHATHANLGSTALSSAALDAAELALLTQTEKSSLNPISFPLQWLMVPPALKATAKQINRNMTGTNNWYGKFGDNDEFIFVNELLSDTNDWYVGSFPASGPILEIGFLDGIQTPQIFLANNPVVGTQFTNDQLQYKVKFVFGGKPVDFRPIFKAVVP